MSQPPPRGPPGPPPGSPPPEGGPPDARALARPAGPPPARPILGPRALPPGVIPRPPGPPQAPPPNSVTSPSTVPLDVRKPPPRGPPPLSPTSTPGGPPMPGPPSGPPSGMPPPRMPGPPPGGPPSGPSAPVSPVGPPPSPGPPSGPPPRGPVVAAFEGGKARAPPKAPPPPDAAPAKAGGKAAPSLPPPGPGAPPPVPKPLERAEEKAVVPGSAPATPSEALPKPSTPTTPTRVPTAPATATPVGPSPSTPPPDAMPPKPALSPTPQGKPPAPTALPADTMPPKPTAPSVPQPKPPAPSAVPQDAMPPKPKPPTPTGSPSPSSPAPPKTGAPPRGPPPTAQGTPADAPRPPSESTTPTSPGSVITQATSSTGSTTSSAPPVRSSARPKPPTRPGDQPAPPDKDGVAAQKLVRSINPETGLPYGLQPAPPSGAPPPAEEKRDRDRPERLTGVSVDDKEGGEEDGKTGSEEVTPKGRKPPSEAPPPLPKEDKDEPGAPSATTAAPDLVIEEEPVEVEAEGTGPPAQAAAPPPPPPPTDVLGPADLFAEDANAQALRKRLKRGRLHIQLVTAKNVRRKDQVAAPTNLNAYVVALLGKTKEPVKAKSEVIKKAGAFIDFNRDELVLNVAEPEALVLKDQIHLLLELWDQGAWQEELLGRGEVPALPFMDMPGAKFEFPVTLLYPGDASSNMELHSQASFEPAKVGMLVFTLYEGRGLKTRGKMDNFITINMGDKYQKRSASVKDGRGSPYFREERLIMWASATNWVDDVWLRVWDEDGGANQLIGEVRFSALPYMSVMPDKFAPQVFALTRLDEDRVGPPVLEESGEVVVKAEFLVAGTMSITVVEAKRLRKSNKAVGRQDPYVVLKMDGQAVALTRKTKVDKDGGSEPVWNETLTFDIVDQYLLEVEVWDQDMRGRDEQIGKCSFSLLSVFKKGAVDTWVVVKRAGDDGLPDESGDVHLVFDFYGPSGIAYPQSQPTVDSYDERARTNLPDDQKAKFARKTEAIVPQQDAKAKTAKADQGRSYEFTDDEIDEAFHFIDLDKNTFLGAAEIRHILVCMGELVTDEEIDAMIHLVDADGDGQVSFREFYKMCIHPNPAQYDCRATKEAEMIGQEQQAKKSDYDREREMAEREEKRKLFTVLTQDNAIGVVESRKIFDRFRNLSVKLSTKGIDFDVFCTLLGVLPTGQYHKLFNLYDREGGGYIDMKEFILGLFNFVNMEKEEKVSLIFQLFDEDRSGFLSEEEIREILKATHLQTADAVNAKLATLMKQVKSPDRTLTYEEFMIIAKKFPTILFPPNIGGAKEDDDINPITGKRK